MIHDHQGILSIDALRGLLDASATMWTPNRARIIVRDALAHIDRLADALALALGQAGHGEHCLLVDFARPYFGPRKCDCWVSQAMTLLSNAGEA